MSRIKRGEPLTKQIIDQMRRRIEAGKFTDNQKLPSESALINEFGVSRAVVREAISNLKAIGMVATRQGVGAFVVRTSANTPFQVQEASLDVLHEVVAVIEVRIAVEKEAAYLAATRRSSEDLKAMRASIRALSQFDNLDDIDGVRADLNFHTAIAKATSNKHFLSLFGYLGAMLIPRSRVRSFDPEDKSRREFIERIVSEHQSILEAIERKDAEDARVAMAAHLQRSKARLQKEWQSRMRYLKRARPGKPPSAEFK